MGTLRPNFIVGIGSSAGGLSASQALLDTLPSDTDMAFVFIAHLMPSASSQLVQILSKHTEMKVMLASDSKPILANHVYVIPPDADLLIENGNFKVVSPRVARNNQIDLFLGSLADAMGASAIGIILSGYNGDGAEGCKKIKTHGGTTFAQDKSAEVNVMPLHSQATGGIDFVLAPNRISAELVKIGKNGRIQR
jgi:two-component system CheB/CheR fusion protein